MTTRLTVVRRPTRLVVARKGVRGPPGGPGPPGGAGHTHVQAVPAATWTVDHLLGRHPAVAVLDAAGREIGAAVHHTSANQVVVSFNVPMAGSANCT